jgi:hypothetical protein
MREVGGIKFLVRPKYITTDRNGANFACCSKSELYITWPVQRHYGTKHVFSPGGKAAEG